MLSVVAVLLVLQSETVWSQDVPDISFKRVADDEDTTLCAVDRPWTLVNILPNQPPVNNVCIPPTVLCTKRCLREPNCVGYNYREDSRHCEIYNFIPLNVNVQSGCSYFQVSVSRTICFILIAYFR